MLGTGMEQVAARRRARELGGIAVSARKGTSDKWNIGGWSEEGDTWIVISRDRECLLDDGNAALLAELRGSDDNPTEDAYGTLERLLDGKAPYTSVQQRLAPALMELVMHGWVAEAGKDKICITDAGRAAWSMEYARRAAETVQV